MSTPNPRGRSRSSKPAGSGAPMSRVGRITRARLNRTPKPPTDEPIVQKPVAPKAPKKKSAEHSTVSVTACFGNASYEKRASKKL